MTTLLETFDDTTFSSNLEQYLANVRGFSSEGDPALEQKKRKSEENILNLEAGRIFRGVDMDWALGLLKGGSKEIANYTNELEFARSYSDIVFEFEYRFDPERLFIRGIRGRKDDVSEYDPEILESGKDGYAWFLGSGMFHLRIRPDNVRLSKIHYCSPDLKENIAYLATLNRKYAGLSQTELASALSTKQPKIAQYENAERLPNLERLLELSRFIPTAQQIDRDGSVISINN